MIRETSGIEYELDLPEDYVQMDNLKELWKLKPDSKTKTVDDYEVRENMLLYYFNPLTLEYYPIKMHKLKDTVKLDGILKDGNLYMNKNDKIWNTNDK